MILYTIGCPQCKVLETKLNQANIKYEICEDREVMRAKHMMAAPMLELDNGEILTFAKAVQWIKVQY